MFATGRQALFNLEETTELTHMGQTLSEIEKYEDPRSDDEGDDTLGGQQILSQVPFYDIVGL